MLEVMMQEKVLYGEVHNSKKKHHLWQDLLLLNLLQFVCYEEHLFP